MAETALPKPVHDFICEHIHSVEQLEVLALLQADPAESWTAQDLADALKTGLALAQSALQHLEREGLALSGGERNESWRFVVTGEELAERARLTVKAYPQARVEVLMLISRCAMERIRTAQVRAFAQAFLLRSPKKGPPK